MGIVIELMHRCIHTDIEIKFPDSISRKEVAQTFQGIDIHMPGGGIDTQSVIQQSDIIVQICKINQRFIYQTVFLCVELGTIDKGAVGIINRIAISSETTVIGICPDWRQK